MADTDLHAQSALAVADAIRRRSISPVEVVDAALARIERLNSAYNAYLTVCGEEARAQAKQAEEAVTRGDELGPLHGVPVSVKDLLYTKGIRSTGGSAVYDGFVPDFDTPLVARLREAGAIILGKTNTPEFGVIPTTENRLGEPCRNPWDRSRTTGGSSGGAAVAALLGLGALHIGSDGGGSIRIPSSFCGVFGLKPTIGRVPPYTKEWGGYGAWPSMAQAGPIARTVEDAALLLDVIAGPAQGDPFALPAAEESFRPAERDQLRLRIAWSPDLGGATVDPEVRSICEAAAKRFAGLGCEVEEAGPEIDGAALGGTFLPIAAAGDAVSHGSLLEEHREQLCDYTARFLEAGMKITGPQYLQAERERVKIWRTMDDFLSRYDLLLTPVLATPAFPIDQPPTVIDGTEVRPMAWTPFTMVCNLTGQPAASLPCGWTSDGLPVGLHLIARAFRERTILEAALAFQRAHPWQERQPPEAPAA
ncbi:MAG: amidase [Chloroflexi bacterium]|nr:amidase [Chloroflexota bacterium]